MSPEVPIRTKTSHDIDLVTGLKLVSIFWAGTMPIVLPAWLIIRAEIMEQNRVQDEKMAAHYVPREEYDELKVELNRRFDAIQKQLETITRNQTKVLIKLKVEP